MRQAKPLAGAVIFICLSVILEILSNSEHVHFWGIPSDLHQDNARAAGADPKGRSVNVELCKGIFPNLVPVTWDGFSLSKAVPGCLRSRRAFLVLFWFVITTPPRRVLT